MALPTTNLSFSQLRNTYGGGTSVSLSQYYSGAPSGNPGGPLVSDETPDIGYGAIPSSGTINLGRFRGNAQLTNAVITGSTTWTAPSTLVGPIKMVLVGGGGASGNYFWYITQTGIIVNDTAGGGAGGVVYATFNVTPGAQYTIVIGAGAGVTDTSNPPDAGSNSLAFGYTAYGGGAGAPHPNPSTLLIETYNGFAGGSGGGTIYGGTAGSGTVNQGNAGGPTDATTLGDSTNGHPSGGGGYQGVGGSGATGGSGGLGQDFYMYNGPRSRVAYPVGGGGAAALFGATHGGGNGGLYNNNIPSGGNGTANSGGGGGGAQGRSRNVSELSGPNRIRYGKGGSGVCLISGYW